MRTVESVSRPTALKCSLSSKRRAEERLTSLASRTIRRWPPSSRICRAATDQPPRSYMFDIYDLKTVSFGTFDLVMFFGLIHRIILSWPCKGSPRYAPVQCSCRQQHARASRQANGRISSLWSQERAARRPQVTILLAFWFSNCPLQSPVPACWSNKSTNLEECSCWWSLPGTGDCAAEASTAARRRPDLRMGRLQEPLCSSRQPS
jgi:hypothetical protein